MVTYALNDQYCLEWTKHENVYYLTHSRVYLGSPRLQEAIDLAYAKGLIEGDSGEQAHRLTPFGKALMKLLA